MGPIWVSCPCELVVNGRNVARTTRVSEGVSDGQKIRFNSLIGGVVLRLEAQTCSLAKSLQHHGSSHIFEQ